jgi:hypothetical protein
MKPIGTALRAAALLAALAPAGASAHVSVDLNIGIPAPVYVDPPPVYYEPPPVYYGPPPPVYYGPRVIYRDHDRDWERRRWHRDEDRGPGWHDHR